MTLAELLATNPSWPASLTDAQALAWLEESVTVQRDITYNDLLTWGEAENTRYKLDNAFLTHATTPWINSVYNSMLLLRDMFQSGANFELSRNEIRAIVNTLSGSGLPFSAANKTAILALSDTSVPRWQDAGIGFTPNLSDVAIARAG